MKGKCWSEVIHNISKDMSHFDANEQKFKSWKENLLEMMQGYAPHVWQLLEEESFLCEKIPLPRATRFCAFTLSSGRRYLKEESALSCQWSRF